MIDTSRVCGVALGLAVAATPLSLGAYGLSSYEESRTLDGFTVSLPGSSRLPEQPRQYGTTLGVDAGGAGLELGCSGVTMNSMFGTLRSDLEMIINYYRNNTGDLLLYALIYTQPQLYSLLNSKIAQFQAHAEKFLVGCAEAREWGMEQNESAWNKCLEDDNSPSYCTDGDLLGEYQSQAAQEKLEELLAVLDRIEPASGSDASSTVGDFRHQPTRGDADHWEAEPLDPASYGEYNAMIASYYQMTPEAQDFFADTITGVAINSDAEENGFIDARSGRTKVHIKVREKLEALLERIDGIVIAYSQERDYSDLMAEYDDEPYSATPSRNQILHLAKLREGAIHQRELDSATTRYTDIRDSRYTATISRLARAQALAYARAATAELTSAIYTAMVDGAAAELFEDARIVEMYERNLAAVEAELTLPDLYDRSHDQQQLILQHAIEYFEARD